MTKPDPQTIDYTITGLAVDELFSKTRLFTVSPAFCDVTLEATDTPAAITGVVTLDGTNQKIDVPQEKSSLTLSGGVAVASVEYDFPVTYKTFNYAGDEKTSDTVTFKINYKNPCIDPAYVSIAAPTLDDQDYIINSGNKDFTVHDAPVVTYNPEAHTLCGTIKAVGKFDGDLIPSTGADPVAYDPANRQFSVDTDDDSYDGTTKQYSVIYSFTDYPVTTFPTATTDESADADIVFIDPCLEEYAFALGTQQQPSPASSSYDSTAINMQVNEFTMTPSRCPVTYTCEGVVQTGQVTSTIGCIDLTSNLVFSASDANANDGQLTITPTADNYADKDYWPGEYTVTVRGTPDEATDGRFLETTFTFTLVDICDPPTSLTASEPTDLDYTITQAKQT